MKAVMAGTDWRDQRNQRCKRVVNHRPINSSTTSHETYAEAEIDSMQQEQQARDQRWTETDETGRSRHL